MSNEERTSWRHEALSKRHRDWGIPGTSANLPMVDIDFLCLDYDSATPKAIIDYKYRDDPLRMPAPDLTHPSYRASLSLCRERDQPMPFLIVYYNQEWTFSVVAVDGMVRVPRRLYSEAEYVRGLYRIHGRPWPEGGILKVQEGHMTRDPIIKEK